jgi:hypothetical protein
MPSVEKIGRQKQIIITLITGNFIVKILSRRRQGIVNIVRSMWKRLTLTSGRIRGRMNSLEPIRLNTIANTGNFIQSRLFKTIITVERVSNKQGVHSPQMSGRTFALTTSIHAYVVESVSQR